MQNLTRKIKIESHCLQGTRDFIIDLMLHCLVIDSTSKLLVQIKLNYTSNGSVHFTQILIFPVITDIITSSFQQWLILLKASLSPTGTVPGGVHRWQHQNYTCTTRNMAKLSYIVTKK